MAKGSRDERQVCRRGLVRADNDGAPKTAKVGQRIERNGVKLRQRSRRAKPVDDAIWGIEGVELADTQLEEASNEVKDEGDGTRDSAGSAAQQSDLNVGKGANLPSKTAFTDQSDFNRFGELAQTKPATCKLPQEIIDRIVEFSVPEVLETHRRWSNGAYYLHILNPQDFHDVGTMLCIKPFHTETLRQISKKVTVYVDISELKVERAQAWGHIPPSLPEHITSRIQRFEFQEAQILDFRAVTPHTIPPGMRSVTITPAPHPNTSTASPASSSVSLTTPKSPKSSKSAAT